jgi:hypothetical protein
MGNNNAKPLESPLPPQSPQTQAAEATPPRQQLLQIFFYAFTFLSGFITLKIKTVREKKDWKVPEMPSLMFFWVVNLLIHLFFLNMIGSTIIDNISIMSTGKFELVIYMLTCAFGYVIMIHITSPWVSLFGGFSWILSLVLVFVPKALPFVKKIYNKIQKPGMWMFGSLTGFVIMWYRRQIFFWSGTQNISTI